MQHHEMAQRLAFIEDLLMQAQWEAWDFELTNTTHLYAPWSSPPLPEVEPSDQVIARYTLKDNHRHPVVFCVAELVEHGRPGIRSEREFLRKLARFHAELEQLPVAMYTCRGESWDYVNLAAGEDWQGDALLLPKPLEEAFVHDIAHRDYRKAG